MSKRLIVPIAFVALLLFSVALILTTTQKRAESQATARLVGAGDIAGPYDEDNKTGDLIRDRQGARVFTTGDNAYENGTTADYRNYDDSWGSFVGRTLPTPGNHDYRTSGASGYKDYFSGKADGPFRTRPTWYAYNLGDWRIYALDSNKAINSGSRQYNFVANDMASNNSLCELAYFHHPLQSTGEHGPEPKVKPIFGLFDRRGGDVILNGHDHNYERFQKMDSSGSASSNGVVQIVIGTGGTELRDFTDPRLPTTEVRNDNSHGILDMTLDPTGYTGEFVPIPGDNFTDNFRGSCSSN